MFDERYSMCVWPGVETLDGPARALVQSIVGACDDSRYVTFHPIARVRARTLTQSVVFAIA